MGKWKVEVKGMKELQREIDNVAEEMKDALQMGTEEAASAVAGIIRSNAPGSIAEAVETKPLPQGKNYPEVTMVGINYRKAPHQHLVEFGSGPRYHASGKYVGQMPAQPFFRQSIDGARSLIKGRIEERASGPIERR